MVRTTSDNWTIIPVSIAKVKKSAMLVQSYILSFQTIGGTHVWHNEIFRQSYLGIPPTLFEPACANNTARRVHQATPTRRGCQYGKQGGCTCLSPAWQEVWCNEAVCLRQDYINGNCREINASKGGNFQEGKGTCEKKGRHEDKGLTGNLDKERQGDLEKNHLEHKEDFNIFYVQES